MQISQQNIWLLTEERPKATVVGVILKNYCDSIGTIFTLENLKIVPVMEDGRFTFRYKLLGFDSPRVKEVIIIPVSGSTSFVDYLLFHQDNEPTDKDKPKLIVEETKTDDTESRNTGTYQRATKFVATNAFYPGVRNVMLYSLHVPQKEKPSATYIFGTRMLRTYGVEVLGKKHDHSLYAPFSSIAELIICKNTMRAPGYGQPVRITKRDDAITISAKLCKGGRLAHDPSIGMVSMMAACIRKLGWNKRIVITNHGLASARAVGNKNKFNYVAHALNIELDGITLPSVNWPERYWKPEITREKTATIFTHVIVENLTDSVAIYENHGGCERGYFMDYSTGTARPIAVEKYVDRELYKSGDKQAIYFIPDLVLWSKARKTVYNIEGKTYSNRKQGIRELNNYTPFEDTYIKIIYPGVGIMRSLVLAGTGDGAVAQRINELCLYLSDKGEIVLGRSAGKPIQEAVSRLSSL